MSNKSPRLAAHEVDVTQRRQLVCELKVKGHSYKAIAAAVGISVGQAFKDFADALAALKRECDEVAEQAKATELLRCDEEYRRADEIQVKAQSSSVVVVHNSDGTETTTVDPVKADLILRASVLKLKVMQRRAKYLGLDAPEKVQTTITTTNHDAVDQLASILDSLPTSGATEGTAGGHTDQVGSGTGGAVTV